MNKTMKQYKGKVLKAMMMLLAVGFALAGSYDDALSRGFRTGWYIYLVFLLF